MVAQYGIGGYTESEASLFRYGVGGVTTALDSKSGGVAGTAISTGVNLMEDTDLSKHSMEDAEMLAKLDLAYAAISVGIGRITGGKINTVGTIGISGTLDQQFNKFKKDIAPPLSPEDKRKRDEQYFEEAKHRMI